ncbi:hypothetical protein HDU83_004465 [Entophlyctis luteolus]|nr:hypothetical protein HDU83_004465 [Entophlyctis luteolus]
MSAAGITVAVATPRDAAGLAATNMSAFWEDRNWRLVFGSRTFDDVVASNTLRWPRNLALVDRATRRHLKAVHDASGILVGYARFILPPALAGSWLDAQVPAPTADEAAEFERRFAAADWALSTLTDHMDVPVIAMKERHFSARSDAIVLDHLAVRPVFQRRGIASQLLAPAIQLASSAGVDIIALATAAGARAYVKLGFRILESLTQDYSPYGGTTEHTMSIVVYESKSPKESKK